MKKVFYTLLTLTIIIFSALTYSYTSSSTIISSSETPDPGHNANQVTVKIGASYKTLQKAIEDNEFSSPWTESSPATIYRLTGKVGIGTTSPTGYLHVKGSVSTDIIVDSPSGSYASYLSLYQNGVKKWSVGQNPSWALGTNDFYIYEDGSLSGTNIRGMVIDKGTGKLGIGTTNPRAQLEVYKTGSSNDGILIYGGSNIVLQDDGNDPGDLIFKDSSNSQKARVWSNPFGGGLMMNGHTGITPDLTISNTGNIGIGTSTPNAKLEISDSSHNLNLKMSSNVGSSQSTTGSPVTMDGLSISGSSGSNYVPGILLQATNSGGITGIAFKSASTNTGYIYTDTNNMYLGAISNALHLYTRSTGNILLDAESRTIEAHSNLWLARSLWWGDKSELHSDEGGAIELGGSAGSSYGPYIDFKNDDTSDYDARIRLLNGQGIQIVGDFSWTGTATGTYSSDERLKKNITSLDINRAKNILKLDGKSYVFKSNDNDDLGLIAQEVQQYFPEIVENTSTGNLGLNYNGLIAPLLEVVKNQEKRILELEKKLENIGK